MGGVVHEEQLGMVLRREEGRGAINEERLETRPLEPEERGKEGGRKTEG